MKKIVQGTLVLINKANTAKWLNIQSNSNHPGLAKLYRCKKHCSTYYLYCFVFLNPILKKQANFEVDSFLLMLLNYVNA